MAVIVLPNMLVIGAGKAGTTSLHYYLGRHPDIYMSRKKELFFFQRENWNERLEWYESCFPKPAAIRGEASPSYSAYPVHPEVPARIHDLIPDAKLIYVVRDPVERIVAQYTQHCAEGKETRPLGEALRSALSNGDDPANPYLCMSRYATQVERYLAHFPIDQIHVIDQVDLRQHRLPALRAAFRFLGVDEEFYSPTFEEMVNTQRDQVRFSRLGAWLRNTPPARFVQASVPRKMRGPVTKPLTRLLSRRVQRPVLSDDLRAQLELKLAPEVERLRELTGKKFAHWSI